MALFGFAWSHIILVRIVSNRAITRQTKPQTSGFQFGQVQWLISDVSICFLKRGIVTFSCIFCSRTDCGSDRMGMLKGTFSQRSDNAEIYEAVNEALPGCVAVSAAELGQRLKLLDTLPAPHCCFFFFPLPEVTLLWYLPLSLHA